MSLLEADDLDDEEEEDDEEDEDEEGMEEGEHRGSSRGDTLDCKSVLSFTVIDRFTLEMLLSTAMSICLRENTCPHFAMP